MDNRKVLFVEPRGSNTNTFSKFMTIPLLGPLYLATMARDAGYDATIVNENILKRDVTDEELIEADQLCLTCLTSTVEKGKAISARYRALREARGLSNRSIIGGIHASMMPDDVSPHFDHVAIGEGEHIILDLLAGKVSTKVVRGTPVKDLDTVPIPDFGLLKGWKPDFIWPVMTSRGCPFDCNFCSVTEMFGRGFRKQSAERVVEEVKRYTGGYLFFVDDNFAVDIKRARRIMDLMREGGIRRPWTTQVRTDVTKRPGLVKQMKDSGCNWVYVGFESVNPDSLEDMQKSQNVEDIKRSIEVFHKNRIRVHGMFMFGSDPDTKAIFDTTTRFARECRIDTVQYNVLTPLPGTRFFKRVVEEDRLLHRNWDYFDGLHVVFQPKNMTPEELQRGMISCFSDFYTYTAAVGDALGTIADKGYALARNLVAAKRHARKIDGALLKLAGRGLVKSWIADNRSYLRYLRAPGGVVE